MALISCPECKRQVSDKAVSCPECGYPLREAMAVLITGPNGIPLLEGVVKEFASFTEWIFGVKPNKEDGDFIQVLIEEWSRNDQHAAMFQITSALLQGGFEARTRLELGEEGHSDTRD